MGRTRYLAAAFRSSYFRCVFRKITPARVRKWDCTGETWDSGVQGEDRGSHSRDEGSLVAH